MSWCLSSHENKRKQIIMYYIMCHLVVIGIMRRIKQDFRDKKRDAVISHFKRKAKRASLCVCMVLVLLWGSFPFVILLLLSSVLLLLFYWDVLCFFIMLCHSISIIISYYNPQEGCFVMRVKKRWIQMGGEEERTWEQ